MYTKLSSPDELPDINEKCIKINYSLEEVENSDHPVDIVLFYEGIELWRETSFFEDIERFKEIAQILVKKYGNQLTDITVNEDKDGAWLFGDRVDAKQVVNRVRKYILRKNNKNYES